MSDHADTIRLAINAAGAEGHLVAGAWDALDALLAENQRLEDELAATEKLAVYEHERYQRLREDAVTLADNAEAYLDLEQDGARSNAGTSCGTRRF